MAKIRTMVMNADRIGGSSTATNDSRLTPIGLFIRRYKLDECLQFFNVLRGEMSVVGPRPQVPAEVMRYTPEEHRLLDVPPGVTDFASIVFADEGDILLGHPDPDLAYDTLIRPWKSRLGLFYVQKRTMAVDFLLVALTAAAIVNRRLALRGTAALLRRLGAESDLVEIAQRETDMANASYHASDQP